MKLFISYARVDQPLCKQIVSMLDDVHETWYDKRLFAGQDWWQEIQTRLQWCEGFVYLLSPESVASDYCQREFALANQLGKHIFPVLIQARTQIPADITHFHYADLSQGMENIHVLLNAITVAERQPHAVSPPRMSSTEQRTPVMSPLTFQHAETPRAELTPTQVAKMLTSWLIGINLLAFFILLGTYSYGMLNKNFIYLSDNSSYDYTYAEIDIYGISFFSGVAFSVLSLFFYWRLYSVIRTKVRRRYIIVALLWISGFILINAILSLWASGLDKPMSGLSEMRGDLSWATSYIGLAPQAISISIIEFRNILSAMRDS